MSNRNSNGAGRCPTCGRYRPPQYVVGRDGKRYQRERSAARRLKVDARLYQVRAAGWSYRRLAEEYGVSASSVARHFARLDGRS